MDPLPPRPPSLTDPQLLWATFALIATLLLGAVIFAWLDRWRKRADRDVLTPADELAAFRQSYDRGELSQEEYERIRAKLAPKVRAQVNLPPKPARPAGDGGPSPTAGEEALRPDSNGTAGGPPPQDSSDRTAE
ncbi:MAG TPA: SHOCT domain-containing protein [Gemmataceae bacterium]|jgi:hypothetical protein